MTVRTTHKTIAMQRKTLRWHQRKPSDRAFVLGAGILISLVLAMLPACSNSVAPDGEGSKATVSDGQARKRLFEKQAFKQALDEIEKQAVRERIASGVLEAEMLVYKALEQRETFGQALTTIAKNRVIFRSAMSKEKTFVQSIASVEVPPSGTSSDIQAAQAIKEMATKVHDLQGRIYSDLLDVDHLVRSEGDGDSTALARAATAKIREVDALAAELAELRNRLETESASFGISR
jgi:hypothetical protein